MTLNDSFTSGEEVSPSESMSKGALHINGDIAFAVRQYLYATRDTALIREEANLIIELASFWASKAKFCHQKMKFEIRGEPLSCNIVSAGRASGHPKVFVGDFYQTSISSI